MGNHILRVSNTSEIILDMEISEGVSQDATAQPLQRRVHLEQESVVKDVCGHKPIEKGMVTRFHFERVLNFDYCLLVFTIMNIALSLFYSDAAYHQNQSVAHICLVFMALTLLVEVPLTIARYLAQVQLEKSQTILAENETIVSSGKLSSLLLEILILLVQPYWFLQNMTFSMNDNYDGFVFDYKLNYVLVVFGFAKMFIILRVVLSNTIYMSPRSNRLCRMYGCESNYLYAIKCLFRDTPMLLIGVVFSFSIFVFAVSLRIAERDVPAVLDAMNNASQGGSQKSSANDISNFYNAMWLTIITMTTVGYGDYYPRTTFGRIIDVFLVVWGTFIVSLMVVVLTNTLNMDQSEKRALIVLNRLQAKKTLKEAAALLITHACKKHLLRKGVREGRRRVPGREKQARMQSTFYRYLTNFKNVRRVIRSMYEIDDVYEEITRQFEFINDEISFVMGSQQETIGNLQLYLRGGVSSLPAKGDV